MTNNFRIGFGYDVHAFCEGDSVVLGGVKIPFSYSLKAHSDGDVLIHAICDSLLGACALGDIGQHFPDNSEEFKNISSVILLEKVKQLLQNHHFDIINVDATIVAEAPKIMPHSVEMIKILSNALQIPADCMSVKATTNEKIGFVGRGEGIAAMAVALVSKQVLY